MGRGTEYGYHVGTGFKDTQILVPILYRSQAELFFFFFSFSLSLFFFFRATPMAYGGSQTRGRIGA